MKIAMVVPELVTGGAETMAVRLASALTKDGCALKLFCIGKNNNGNLNKQLMNNRVQTVYISGKNRMEKVLTLYFELKKYKPDVVHGHIAATLYALPWILLNRRKCLHTVHTRPDMEFSSKTQKIMKRLVKRGKVVLCAVSKENQKIASEFYGIDISKVRYVNNPVVISHYRKEKKQSEQLKLINVSRQDINKNQILILKAMCILVKQLPNVHLVLVGDGNQHDKLVRYAKEHGLERYVTFTGQIDDAVDYLAASDIYISSSHREALPLSILEAMASRLPIVTTNVGGIPDLMKGNGLLFEDDNYEQLSAEIIKLHNNPALISEMGEMSYKIVKEFDVSKCASMYKKIYAEIGRK